VHWNTKKMNETLFIPELRSSLFNAEKAELLRLFFLLAATDSHHNTDTYLMSILDEV